MLFKRVRFFELGHRAEASGLPLSEVKKKPAKKARAGNEDTVGDDANSGNEEATTLAKKTPPEIYADREEEGLYANDATAQWATEAAMVDFMAQIDRHGNRWTRRASPKVVKLRPYLNLDMSSATTAKMARMTLRAYRPFVGRAADPMLIQDDSVAVEELEVIIRSSACPRHLVERYQQHNRRRGQKRKRNKFHAKLP